MLHEILEYIGIICESIGRLVDVSWCRVRSGLVASQDGERTVRFMPPRDDSSGGSGNLRNLDEWLSFGNGSIPITIFRWMNIHQSQLFWCELQILQGYYWFWHTPIWCHLMSLVSAALWSRRGAGSDPESSESSQDRWAWTTVIREPDSKMR